ncbi:hypothetical protein RHMOL_Rhmol01G0350400 [Rhododendron molle]|uniref:Uncharacterized protein n=1 Tax=Rhododendron molle TaxID=49168 RepID=A0ACC0QAB0_RHOML|nr:hypothetical protein RHMOL_Rhmol01G0350400 [Rhododendron molle]
MAKSSLLCVSLCCIVLFSCSVAFGQQEALAYGQQGGRRGEQGQRGQRRQGDCQLNNLNAQEPQHRIQAEAGVTEFWDFNDDQFQCAGVAACRNIIQPRGLFLPAYTNAPSLVYILRGRGIQGVMMSGCPETYQSSEQSEGGGRREGRGQRFRDQHQKIRRFREGDVIALPAGVAHWCYNDGDSELIFVIMEDLGNHQNQLDNNPRKFFLAGNPQQQGQGQQQQQRESYRRHQGQEQNFGNVLSGFDTEVLAEAFGVDRETARKLQGQDDDRGHIIKVEGDLQVLRPSMSREEQEEQERGREYGRRANGLEETICSARLVENINDPSRADIFNPRAGRLTTVNSFNLPILNFIRLSAEKGVLYRNALMPPHFKNAHCVLYATRGEAQMQIVDQRGQAVFNDRIREGQLVVVPHNFVVSKQAGDEGFEWVAMKTHENAKYTALAGHTSVLRAMPVDVLANAYQISRDEAMRLKMSREETMLMEPRRSGRRDVA